MNRSHCLFSMKKHEYKKRQEAVLMNQLPALSLIGVRGFEPPTTTTPL